MSRLPPQTSSTASSVQPPAKTDSRRKSACSSSPSSSKLQPIVSRSARCRAGASREPEVSSSSGCSSRARIPLGDEHLHPRRGQLDRERQAVEVVADLRARGQLGLVRLEVGPHGARPLEEDAQGVVALERLERELLLPADAQPRAARDDGLQARARRRRSRRATGAASTTCSKLSTTSSSCRPSRWEMSRCSRSPSKSKSPSDRAIVPMTSPGSLHRLERHEDRAVRELVCGRRGDARARRVFPTPPGPVIVSSRTSSRWRSAAASARLCSRPIRPAALTRRPARAGAPPSRARTADR